MRRWPLSLAELLYDLRRGNPPIKPGHCIECGHAMKRMRNGSLHCFGEQDFFGAPCRCECPARRVGRGETLRERRERRAENDLRFLAKNRCACGHFRIAHAGDGGACSVCGCGRFRRDKDAR